MICYRLRLRNMKLLLVYNTHSDPFSTVVDYVHKMFSPSTYKCDLCALTHHHLGERSVWKNFRKSSGVEMEFMYIRQYERKYKERHNYPVVLKVEEGERKVLISKEHLRSIKDVNELITLIMQFKENEK